MCIWYDDFKQGDPLSWRHYVYGTQYLSRADLRETLREAVGVRFAVAIEKSYEDWRRDMLFVLNHRMTDDNTEADGV